MRLHPQHVYIAAATLALGLTLVPSAGSAAVVRNPICPIEDAFYSPDEAKDIVLPPGFKASVFVKDLNGPVGIAFVGNGKNFKAYVLESGHGLPSICNDEDSSVVGGTFSRTNPFTPDILVFDQNGRRIAGPLAKPLPGGGGLLPHGPAIGIAFEKGFNGGRLFVTDSNQAIREVGGQNNSSRIVMVDPDTGAVTPFITGLPTGDHPAEQLAFKDGWIYWSQGSTTNSGVVGRDNGGGANQPDIPCQDIVLSNNVFNSGPNHPGGPDVLTSGYSPFGTQRPATLVPAFNGRTDFKACDGAILRASLKATDPARSMEPFSWGYRNPYGIRFAPKKHALQGGLFVTENGEDERGARPVNNSPDRLALAQQNHDGSPDYHGWPDRFGFLDSTQAVFNPVGGPGDDLCVPDPHNPPSMCTPASLQRILTEDRPVKTVLAFPPQPITAPIALEPADVAAVGLDFVPGSFVGGVVKKNAVLLSREGDFGFSTKNGDPILGHDVELINFTKLDNPNELQQSRFAFNCPQHQQGHNPDGSATCDVNSNQAFTDMLRGINRPTTIRFGPDGAAYLVDYGAVRDFGRSVPASRFANDADAPLVQIPGTGTIWRISRVDNRNDDDDDDRHGHGKHDD